MKLHLSGKIGNMQGKMIVKRKKKLQIPNPESDCQPLPLETSTKGK